MADELITLAEYKVLLDEDPSNPAQVVALIPAASRSVRKFTDRNFEVAGTPADRTFQYDGSGFLDIDDCTAITAVMSDLGYPSATPYSLATPEFTAMPHREQADDDPYYYLLVHSHVLPASPEMGFERNLDRLGFSQVPPVLTVTATWGWPVIPEDVKLATAIVVQDLLASTESGGGDLTSEAIGGHSRSWAPRPNTMLAIPNRARDLLLNYQRVYG
jgi:hypothetical protein